MSQASKVLIIQTAFLGDAVLITSLLEKIRLESTNTLVHLLVRKGLEDVFSAYPHDHLVQVWTYDKRNKLNSWWTLRNELTKEKFDQVFVAQRFFGMGLLSISIGAKKLSVLIKTRFPYFSTKKFRMNLAKENMKRNEIPNCWLHGLVPRCISHF